MFESEKKLSYLLTYNEKIIMKKIDLQKIKLVLNKSLSEDNALEEYNRFKHKTEEEILQMRRKEMKLAEQIWAFHQDYSETPRDVKKTPEEFANDAINLYVDAVSDNRMSGRNCHEPLENFNFLRKIYVTLFMISCAI